MLAVFPCPSTPSIKICTTYGEEGELDFKTSCFLGSVFQLLVWSCSAIQGKIGLLVSANCYWIPISLWTLLKECVGICVHAHVHINSYIKTSRWVRHLIEAQSQLSSLLLLSQPPPSSVLVVALVVLFLKVIAFSPVVLALYSATMLADLGGDNCWEDVVKEGTQRPHAPSSTTSWQGRTPGRKRVLESKVFQAFQRRSRMG